MDDWLVVLTVATALGCALMAGTFFAFSAFVMAGLGRLPAPQGIAAMQGINASVGPVLVPVLVGTAAGCAALVVAALADLGASWAPWLLAGAALYLVCGFGLTAVFHVPRNVRLDAVDPGAAGAREAWDGYRGPWTAGNHVRTLGCAAALLALLPAL